MLYGVAERGNCALACLLAVQVAILSQRPHAHGCCQTSSRVVGFPSPIDRVRVTEIRGNVLNHAILPRCSQSHEDATLHKVHPRWAIDQLHQLIDTSRRPSLAQRFRSRRFHQVANIAFLQQDAEGLCGTFSKLCLRWCLELSQRPGNCCTHPRELRRIKLLESLYCGILCLPG